MLSFGDSIGAFSTIWRPYIGFGEWSGWQKSFRCRDCKTAILVHATLVAVMIASTFWSNSSLAHHTTCVDPDIVYPAPRGEVNIPLEFVYGDAVVDDRNDISALFAEYSSLTMVPVGLKSVVLGAVVNGDTKLSLERVQLDRQADPETGASIITITVTDEGALVDYGRLPTDPAELNESAFFIKRIDEPLQLSRQVSDVATFWDWNEKVDNKGVLDRVFYQIRAHGSCSSQIVTQFRTIPGPSYVPEDKQFIPGTPWPKFDSTTGLGDLSLGLSDTNETAYQLVWDSSDGNMPFWREAIAFELRIAGDSIETISGHSLSSVPTWDIAQRTLSNEYSVADITVDCDGTLPSSEVVATQDAEGNTLNRLAFVLPAGEYSATLSASIPQKWYANEGGEIDKSDPMGSRFSVMTSVSLGCAKASNMGPIPDETETKDPDEAKPSDPSDGMIEQATIIDAEEMAESSTVVPPSSSDSTGYSEEINIDSKPSSVSTSKVRTAPDNGYAKEGAWGCALSDGSVPLLSILMIFAGLVILSVRRRYQ